MKTYTYNYPKPSVTADCIVVRSGERAEILLIKRKHNPYMGKWALPGGFVEIEEDLEDGAIRELEEETGLKNINLIQFKSYGKPGRDPRGRTISVVYYGFLVNKNQEVNPGDDAADAGWFSIDDLPELAFDHKEIIQDFIRDHPENLQLKD